MRWIILFLLLATTAVALPLDFDPRIPGWYGVGDDEVNVCRVFGGRDEPVDEEPEVELGGTAQTLELPTETTATLQGIRRQENGSIFYEFEYFVEPVTPITVSFFIEIGEEPADAPSPVNFLFNRQISNRTFETFNFSSPSAFHSIVIAYQGERVSVPLVSQ
ncbi:MAG: hypothetical protein QF486_00200 [Candidatus Woesearchaeota archaeon]|jgi:hypothetical protein|nr:hypothetical protein [Candidatus Woesearchaeota archaeon]MDP7181356.1 hypothetical protein [Candidatus Woesearchaeota archaeon]MDP7198026.1 hypothetical protein [Candidatus Woesearchaeota archaeon]MDP7466860.1 hypothetical protein [Candidatus Woesearchaeota archaeon]MDP7647296.1 hypothetical protein [Candidatus Woesearchaeota archaeon]